jgi:DNA-binding CsgD family transcriptional regulator
MATVPGSADGTDLVGREKELAQLAQLVAATRDGLSGAVVLRGGPGIGKTALLDAAVRAAPDLAHLHVAGVEAESDFAFAGVQRFAQSQLGDGATLPGPQRDAIDVAFGRSTGPPADPFMVGLAVLSLLADAATDRPTIVTVDDAHWLDRESLLVLGFAARRLDAEGVAMVFAARPEETDLSPFDGLVALEVHHLGRDESLELLQLVVESPIDARVADRVVDATAGNPLALRDLGASLSEAQLDGREHLPEPLPVGARLEAHYTRAVGELPEATRTWLLVASAEPSGDLGAIGRAAADLGLPTDAAGPAERTGLVSVRDEVAFRHPLVRAAVYGAATGSDRRAAHHALARAIDASADPDRHARHLAAAAAEPDEVVADALEQAASRAEHRGGLAARADLLTRAAALSPDRQDVARRLLAAADAAFSAGAGRRAVTLVESIEPADLDVRSRASAKLVHTWGVSTSGEPHAAARISANALDAAAIAAEVDADLTQEALALACQGVTYADRLLDGTSVEAIADAAFRAPPGSDTTSRRLVEGFAALLADDFADAMPLVRRAIASLLDPATPDAEVLRWHILGITMCTATLDHESGWTLGLRADGIARATGALGTLDPLLYARSMTATIFGWLDTADALLAEGVQLHTVLARSTREFDIYRHPELAAWRGESRATIEEMAAPVVEAGTTMGHGAAVATVDVARTIHGLSCGDYASARAAGLRLVDGDQFAIHTRVLPDLVEAAVRDGDADVATEALALLRERATASQTQYARTVLARAEALLTDDANADAAYEAAVDVATGTGYYSDLARAHLLHGEWLRRQRRPTDAREQLRTAHSMFTEMGAAGWAERARVELAATGEKTRARTVDATGELTAQERQIAVLAAEGLTNAEIASRLFISAPTVDYHLRKVFRKLDIGSRRQLRGRNF